MKTALFVGISILILLEYVIVPPFLSVNLTETPEVYKQVKALPKDSVIIEVPMRRINGNLYQGYQYYQMYHGKKLFNTYIDIELSRVPPDMRSFYRKMENPAEVGKYENLSVLKELGVTHLVYHYYIGTKTVKFLALPAPIFESQEIAGLHCIYRGQRKFEEHYNSPYDYSFADLYEITTK